MTASTLFPSVVLAAFGLVFIWMGGQLLWKGHTKIEVENERSFLLGVMGIPTAERETRELRGKEVRPRAYTAIGGGILCLLVAVALLFPEWWVQFVS